MNPPFARWVCFVGLVSVGVLIERSQSWTGVGKWPRALGMWGLITAAYIIFRELVIRYAGKP